MGLRRLEFDRMNHGFLNVDSVEVIEIRLVAGLSQSTGERVAGNINRRAPMKPKLVPLHSRHSIPSGTGNAVDQKHQVQRFARDQIGQTPPLVGLARQSPLTTSAQRRRIPVDAGIEFSVKAPERIWWRFGQIAWCSDDCFQRSVRQTNDPCARVHAYHALCAHPATGFDTRMRYRIHCDGASRGNPGEAAAGVVIYDAYGAIAGRIALRLGVLTNNQAEYQAVLAGMRLVEQLRPSAIEFRLDSELAARQLSGAWKIKNAGLRNLAARVHAATPQGVPVEYVHVARSQNSLADRLANWALDRTSPDTPNEF